MTSLEFLSVMKLSAIVRTTLLAIWQTESRTHWEIGHRDSPRMETESESCYIRRHKFMAGLSCKHKNLRHFWKWRNKVHLQMLNKCMVSAQNAEVVWEKFQKWIGSTDLFDEAAEIAGCRDKNWTERAAREKERGWIFHSRNVKSKLEGSCENEKSLHERYDWGVISTDLVNSNQTWDQIHDAQLHFKSFCWLLQHFEQLLTQIFETSKRKLEDHKSNTMILQSNPDQGYKLEREHSFLRLSPWGSFRRWMAEKLKLGGFLFFLCFYREQKK